MPKGDSYLIAPPEVIADMYPRLGWMHGVLAFLVRDAAKANA